MADGRPQPRATGGSALDATLAALTNDMNAGGTYSGMCGGCMKPIIGGGQKSTALGKDWHPECFACYQCRKLIGSAEFFDVGGQPYCKACHTSAFAPKCAYCSRAIDNETCITALGKTWHSTCFLCGSCGASIGTKSYREVDGRPWCANCNTDTFAARCKGCSEPIEGTTLTAINSHWHPRCFDCLTCGKNLEGKAFFESPSDATQPVCEACAQEEAGQVCVCGQAITGTAIRACGRRYHRNCFTCSLCVAKLEDGFRSATSNGVESPYCIACHVKLFG